MRALLEVLEPEEFVGRHWHRFAARTASLPRFPAAAVALETVQPALGVLFRGLGGAPGLRILPAAPARAGHRLGLRQRLGIGEERLARAGCDGRVIHLPAVVDALPEPRLNRALLVWLAAFFAHCPPLPQAADPLRHDLLALRQARLATERTLAACPGLRAGHAELCAVLLQLRPRRRLPPAEAAVEQAIRALLGEADGGPLWPQLAGAAITETAPRGYRRFLPVPLWGKVITAEAAGAPPPDAAEAAGTEAGRDEQSRAARRAAADQTERKDWLALNRFEKILSLVESMNISRPVQDDDEEGARQALEDADEVVLSAHSRCAATRLKLELDLSPAAAEAGEALSGLAYPEWDHGRQTYRPGYCRVRAGIAAPSAAAWEPDAQTRRRIRRVRRHFEAWRPRPELLRAQQDGNELDLEALVRARADLAAQGVGSDRIHTALRRQARDLSVLLLADASLSTDAWIDGRQVIDIEREALLVFTHALTACGDPHAILSFTSRRRHDVRVETVKGFDEPLGETVRQRIAGLRPGHYTRMGAAIRHAAAQLADRPERCRLLLVLTDGKPNDIDHYEGRYGLEDTRRAVGEARRAGVRVFGITVDARAQAYFPLLFGRGGYAIVGQAARLPALLPALYRQIAIG